MKALTVLYAIRTPLIFCYFAEDSKSLVEKFVNDAVFCVSFQVLEGMLNKIVLLAGST